MAYLPPYTRVLPDGRTLEIRVPEGDDAEAMLAIMAGAKAETPFLSRGAEDGFYTLEQETEVLLAQRDDPNEFWQVAFVDGVAAGSFALTRCKRPTRYRHRAGFGIAILRAYWGLGIGRTMMERAIGWCRDAGVEQLELEVVTANTRAIALYERCGFVKDGLRRRVMKYPDGSYADEWLMRLPLGENGGGPAQGEGWTGAYWDAVARQDAAGLRAFFAPDAVIRWHCTNEEFTLEEFIRANCEYPGDWNGQVERVEMMGDVEVTAARVWGAGQSFHASSFFRLRDGLIAALDEYWGDDGEAPGWRREMGIGRGIRPGEEA